ncbi:MAG: thioredoxin [Candidatus Woesearchaeota archaeon]
MAVVELNDKTFSEAISDEMPVVVDFWAEWCMPCIMMAPVLEQASKEYAGRLKFAKLHTVDYPEYAEEFGIDGIPCLVVFKGGKEIGRIVGYMPTATLKQRINGILSMA